IQILRLWPPPHPVHRARPRKVKQPKRSAAGTRQARHALGAGDLEALWRGRQEKKADAVERLWAAQQDLSFTRGPEPDAGAFRLGAQARRQRLDPQTVVDEIFAAGRLEVGLGCFIREQPLGEARDVAVTAVVVEEEGARLRPQRPEERRREGRNREGPGGAGGPAGAEPEGWIEGEEITVGDGAAAAVEIERPREDETGASRERREDQPGPPFATAKRNDAEEERQGIGQEPHVASDQEVEDVPGRLPELEFVRRFPGAVAARGDLRLPAYGEIDVR